MQSDRTPSTETVPVSQKITFREAVGIIFRKPSALLLTLAFAGMVFVNVGYLTWMPTFLLEKFSLSLSKAGFSSMFYHHLAAFAGVLAGGKLSDKWAKKRPRARFEVQAMALLLGVPFIYWMGAATTETSVYIALAAFGFFRGVYDSNIFASLYEVIEPRYRASASGIMLMFAFLTGAFAPYLLGVIKPGIGLSVGLSALSIFYVLSSAAIFLAIGLFFYKDVYIEKPLQAEKVNV
jgi:sugar phosphate permease